MFRHFLSLVVLLVSTVVLLAACEQTVYQPAEISAKRKFESIKVGQTESELRTILGEPQGSLLRKADGQGATYTDLKSGRSVDIDPKVADRTKWPPEVKFLPDREVTKKVLINVSDTVTAFYFISPSGTVTYVDVYVT